jgi:hypothetical protein
MLTESAVFVINSISLSIFGVGVCAVGVTFAFAVMIERAQCW